MPQSLRTHSLVFALVFGSSFSLNFLWEHFHSLLYVHYKGGPITDLILLRATLGDAVMLTTLAVPFVFLPFFRARIWLILPLGFILAIGIELFALETNRWAYGPFMPLVPIFSVGLTPTIQLAITGYVSYLLTFRIFKKVTNEHPAQ